MALAPELEAITREIATRGELQQEASEQWDERTDGQTDGRVGEWMGGTT